MVKFLSVNIGQKQLIEVTVSNKQIKTAVNLAKNLTKDISGNLLTGQEIRVVEYLKILRSVLDTLEEKLEAGNDFKAEQKLDKAMQAVNGKLDKMTPIDRDLVKPSLEKWEATGVSFSSLLDTVAE